MNRPAAEEEAAGEATDPQALAHSIALARNTAALIGAEAAARGRMGIAVSGGPDSMALLDLAAEAFPGRVAAATVDHGLRADSGDEAAMVARHCGERAIPHAILRPATPIDGSIQASARAARYALLDQWRRAHGIGWIMTAHHADDQLETLVMRLNRGSGVGGLAGVRAVQGHVLRPLLSVRRSALMAWAVARGLPFVTDPSNSDERFDRARIRAALAGQELIDPAAVSMSAALLDGADQALEWSAERLAAERLRTMDAGEALLFEHEGLPAELIYRLLLRALAMLEPQRSPPRRSTIEHALAAVSAGQQAMIGNIILSAAPGGGGARGAIRLHHAPPRRAGGAAAVPDSEG